MNPLVLYLERKFAAFILRILKKTLSFKVINQNLDSQSCIYMFWHRNLLPLCLQRMGDPIVVLISPSIDGELLAGPVQELGYKTVRGSSNRKSTQGLMQMVKLAEKHQLGITPDGPKGPIYSIQPGVLQIAYLAKIPIIPVAVDISREWVFNSWDRFRLPKPFARVKVLYGAPINIESKEDWDTQIESLQQIMKDLELKVSL